MVSPAKVSSVLIWRNVEYRKMSFRRRESIPDSSVVQPVVPSDVYEWSINPFNQIQTPSIVTLVKCEYMITGPAGSRVKSDCTDEGQ
jgi:hypothetical protein